MIKRFVIYSMLGIYMEIMWTGTMAALSGRYSLEGHSSVIMMIIYGSVVLMEPAFKQLRGISVIVRGIIYSLLIFSVEYFSGTFLMLYNICPWNYSSSVYNMNNVIRLDYMPLWFFVGLLYERLYFHMLRNNNN